MAAGEVRVEPTKVTWLNIVAAAGDTAPTIAGLRWLVVEAPGEFEFVTSDTPIVKVLTDSAVPRMFAGGWLSPSAEATFALDPHHVLVMTPSGLEGRIRGKPVWCRDVNTRTVRQARRFVFARSRERFIPTVMNKSRRVRETEPAQHGHGATE